MSVETCVFFKPTKLVTASQWKDTILSLGYDIVLDDNIDMKAFSGFLPVMHKGSKSGFEYYYSEPSQEELFKIDIPPEYQSLVTLKTGSNFDEMACSSAAVAALCSVTDGIIFDPLESVQVGSDACKEWGEHGYRNAIGSTDLFEQKRKMTVVGYIDRFIPMAFLITGLIRKVSGLTSRSKTTR